MTPPPHSPFNAGPDRSPDAEGGQVFGAPPGWTPTAWRERLDPQQVVFADRENAERVATRLGELPPLVTSWEVQRLTDEIAQAQRGERFILQGGDCAEMVDDCRPDTITGRLKILLQMSLVLVHGSRKPVTRIGRMAGQYAKPRSSKTETRDVDGREVTLPSYFGDLVNRVDFDQASREPDPGNMLKGYHHAAMTLNFIRSLVAGGFADVHHPEYWNLEFLDQDKLPSALREEYRRASEGLADALRFMDAIGESGAGELTRAEFFTSHEALNLIYESAQTRRVPHHPGWFDLTTHMPWIGERTRSLDGAHVEFCRGIRNPVGVKLGPTATAQDALELLEALNPDDEPGRSVLIVRMGADKVKTNLPPLVEGVRASGRNVLWVSDPMHGNTRSAGGGRKTRSFDDILSELIASIDIHEKAGSYLGGVHFELTGENVTECVGGASGLTDDDLHLNYESACDPRLNYEQAMEIAFLLARHIR